MIEYANNPPYDHTLNQRNETCLAISLQEFKSPKYNYTIFVNSKNVPQLYKTYIDPYSKAPDLSAFGWLKVVGVFQILLDSLILKEELFNDKAFISYAFLPMHTEEYKASFMSEDWHVKVIWLFPLLSASISLGFLVWRLGVDQKVIKESMAFNNMSSAWYHIPMLTFFSLFSLLNSFIISILLQALCLQNANLLALWITIFLCLVNVYPYALCISILFNNSLALSMSSMVLYMAMSLITSQYALGATYAIDKTSWSFLPSISCLFCIKNFFGDGSITNDYYNYRITFGWLLMFIDLIFGFLIGLLLDRLVIVISFSSANTDIKFKGDSSLKIDTENQLLNEDTGKVYVVCGNSCNIYLLNKVMELKVKNIRKRVGVLFKDGHTLDLLTVQEHLKLHIGIEGSNYEEIKNKVEELANKFNLPLNKKGKKLSQKEKKVLYIILLFAKKDNTLLVLDEPTHGVSEKYHQLIHTLVMQKKQCCSILIGTRNEREAELLADFLLIHSKRILVNEWEVPERHYVIKTDTTEKTFTNNERKEIENQIKSNGADFQAGKIREYSIHCKTGFHFPSASSRINTSIRQHVIAPLNYSQKFFSKIWAIFWCTWISTIRDIKVFFFEFAAPLMTFSLLFILSNYVPSNSYTYSWNDFPENMRVPVNLYTLNNKTTELLFNKIESRLITTNIQYSNTTKIANITSNFSSLIYNQSKTQYNGFLGGYYITDYNESNIQALIFGNITSPHMPTFFANTLSNLYLKNLKGNLHISTSIIPISFYRASSDQITEFNMKFLFVIITSLSITISVISMGYVIAQERIKLLKLFQVTNGLRMCEYWVGKMLTDLSKLLILLVVLFVMHRIFDIGITHYPFILIGSYFSCLAFFYYLNSFSQKLFAFSFLTLLVHCIIVIPAAMIITMIKLSVILQQGDSSIWNLIDIIARIIPIYNLTATLVSSVFNSLMVAEGHSFFSSSLTWNFLSIWILFSSLSFALYFVLLILTDDSMSARNLSKAYNLSFKI